MENLVTFNARFVSAVSSDRGYRVYVKGNDLFFIQVGGGLSTNPEMLTVHFGLVGAMIGAALKKRAKKKSEAIIQRIDQQDPEQLLAEHKHNFKLYAPEIQEAVIDPPAFFQLHGKQAGRLKLSLRDGRKMKFQFDTPEDMNAALSAFPRLLSSTLQVNAEWNEAKKRFQKKKIPSLA